MIYSTEYGVKFARQKKKRPADWLIIKKNGVFTLFYMGQEL